MPPENKQLCSVGTATGDDCDGSFTHKTNLSAMNLELIQVRSGCENLVTVCDKHSDKYLRSFFLIAGRQCCNPFQQKHEKPGSDLKVITWDLYVKWKEIENIKLIPGKKVCRACRDCLNRVLSGKSPPHEALAPEEILEVIYGAVPLPDNNEDKLIEPQVSGLSVENPNTPSQSPAKLNAPLQSPLVTRLKQEYRNPASSSPTGSSASEGQSTDTSDVSSQDFWTLPEDSKDYKRLYCIAELLEVDLPKLSIIKTKARLLVKTVELMNALKSLILKVTKTSPRFQPEENPLKITIDYEDTCFEMFQQMKDKFWISQSHEEKIHIMSLVPHSWSWMHIMEEFEVGRKVAEKVVELVNEQGILPSVNPRGGKTLKESVANEVKAFYYRSDVSRELPGKKDYKSVKEGGKRIQKQKRLFLTTLREGYEFFKQEYPQYEIGFSKFAELRPEEVVLAGSSGTHSVCVCTTHQNMILMISGSNLNNLADIMYDGEQVENLDYKKMLEKIHCPVPTVECHLQKCASFPGPNSLRPLLSHIFEERMVERVEFKQWTTTDRSKLITQVRDTEEFINDILEALPALSIHSYISKQQAKFYQEKKNSLKPGEAVVVLDFSENYSFIVQDAVQGYHWSNDQATLHPFVVYTKQSNASEPVAHSLIILSDDMKHNTGAVFAFQREQVHHLRNNLGMKIERLIYFSDSAGGQYKNKFNAANLMSHKEDFGIDAEWHFFATSHGKGPSDGVGGAFKREAASASLRAVMSNQITNVQELYDWGKLTMKKSALSFVAKEKVEETRKELSDRFEKAIAVPKIRQQHCLIPMGEFIMSIARDSYGAEHDIIDLNPDLHRKRKR
ncbi:ARL14 effector protein [Frankliniella fusca]|uniref:ARL14 effector protein n=1 Tax=Frankliniella fusca TaxID=407009 RepID=A0AAE1HQ55_9NEOP|nr:ARL14 effector protein [Frankliniella fusca]